MNVISSAISNIADKIMKKKSNGKKVIKKKSSLFGLGTWESHVPLTKEFRDQKQEEREKKGIDTSILKNGRDPNLPRSVIRTYARQAGFERVSSKAMKIARRHLYRDAWDLARKCGALLDGTKRMTLKETDVAFIIAQPKPGSAQLYGDGEVPKKRKHPKKKPTEDDKDKKETKETKETKKPKGKKNKTAADPEYKPGESEDDQSEDEKSSKSRKSKGKGKDKKKTENKETKRSSGKGKGTKRGRSETKKETEEEEEEDEPKQVIKRARRETKSETKSDAPEQGTPVANSSAQEATPMDVSGDGNTLSVPEEEEDSRSRRGRSKTPSKPSAPAAEEAAPAE